MSFDVTPACSSGTTCHAYLCLWYRRLQGQWSARGALSSLQHGHVGQSVHGVKPGLPLGESIYLAPGVECNCLRPNIWCDLDRSIF